jgi:hypothetical protein
MKKDISDKQGNIYFIRLHENLKIENNIFNVAYEFKIYLNNDRYHKLIFAKGIGLVNFANFDGDSKKSEVNLISAKLK